MSVVVRFAPSPTGFLHIGGARTALFNYLFAKHHHGKFLLRIEDTDKARSTQQAIDVILEGLAWLGLSYDEKPVLQSQNQARHQQVAKQLLETDKAYLCYTSVEELEERRKQAESKGEVFRFQSIWRNKVMSQHSAVQPVLRIKASQEGFSTISDLVQGKVSVANSELDDLILLRSDQAPTYMFAVVVDVLEELRSTWRLYPERIELVATSSTAVVNLSASLVQTSASSYSSNVSLLEGALSK